MNTKWGAVCSDGKSYDIKLDKENFTVTSKRGSFVSDRTNCHSD